MRIGSQDFDFINNSYIMGILNVTPDSFSDGGRYASYDDVLFRAQEMISEGASIIDVGGESTRPGHDMITVEEEICRVVPVLEALKRHFDVPVSLDTWKYEVADAGIRAGADMINDVCGLLYDQGQMAQLIARSGLPCCLMHNGRLPGMLAGNLDGSLPEDGIKSSYLDRFCLDIDRILERAEGAGIHNDRIILDPGIGFGKNQEQNIAIMGHLALLKRWKLPVLLGTSRKTMIGHALGLPVDEREEGTIATTVIGRMAGVSVFRVHNVKGNYRALKMTDSIF